MHKGCEPQLPRRSVADMMRKEPSAAEAALIRPYPMLPDARARR